jgi:hypothetical protein
MNPGSKLFRSVEDAFVDEALGGVLSIVSAPITNNWIINLGYH